MADIDAKKIEELRGLYARFHATDPDEWRDTMRGKIAREILKDKAFPALLDLAERASLPLAGDVDGLCARLLRVEPCDLGPFLDDDTGPFDRQRGERFVNPDGLAAATLIRSLAGRVEAERRAKEEAERERDSWKAVCRKAGVCMSCAIAMPDPHGCFDCLNTGWEGGAPKGSAPEKIVTPLHSDGEPLSMEGAIAANRPCATHCTVCEGEEHHWLDECADEGDPIQVCKHCNAWRPFGDDADD